MGFPNVRAAETSTEKEALDRRAEVAFQSAKAAGYEKELTEFRDAVSEQSVAVIARPLMVLQRIVSNANAMFMTFYQEVGAGGRTAEDNDFDRGREQIDSFANPLYFRDLHFAALSMNGEGVRHYGDFHATLSPPYIRSRASVFEENPLKFGSRHRVVVGQSCPPGYRASWSERGKLAIAKLFHRLHKGTLSDEYPALLIDPGTGRGDEDFIEVHIFGMISAGTIERVIAYAPKGRERHIWRDLRRKLEDLGIAVEVR